MLAVWATFAGSPMDTRDGPWNLREIRALDWRDLSDVFLTFVVLALFIPWIPATIWLAVLLAAGLASAVVASCWCTGNGGSARRSVRCEGCWSWARTLPPGARP